MGSAKGGSGNGPGTVTYPGRQVDTMSYYKKFRFTGLIELYYTDYTYETEYSGKKTKTGAASFDQIYRAGVQGYIYDPRLALFSAAIDYKNSKTKVDNSGGNTFNSDEITYALTVDFIPKRPISLSVYALKTDSNAEGYAGIPFDGSSTLYGARLFFNLKKFPVIRMEYSHSDYSFNRMTGRRIVDYDIWEPSPLLVEKKLIREHQITDKYSLLVTGSLRPLKTRYSFGFDLSQFESSMRKYDALYLRLITNSTIRKETSLSNSFQYTDINFTKLLCFNSFLRLPPVYRINQSYGFEYLSSETDNDRGSDKTTLYTFNGIWRYRYSTRISSMANFHYKFGSSDGENQNAYDFDFSVNYGKPIRGFDFTTYAGFSFGREEKNGIFQSLSNNAGFILSTRRLRWARVSFKYDFHYLSIDFTPATDEPPGTVSSGIISESSADIENKFKLTVQGRGPGRAYWNTEAEARFLTSSNKGDGAWRSVWFGEKPYGNHLNHYTFYAEVGHPLGRRGVVTLRASYTTGETDSEKVNRYYYETRARYTVIRNMNVSVWWREEWHNRAYWNNGLLQSVRAQDEIRTRDYSFDIYYGWRKLTFSLEYSSQLVEEGPLSYQNNRLYLRASRSF